MPILIVIGIIIIVGLIILYFLLIGGVLIWPLINVVAYLKVLIFPQAVRKTYGTNVAALSNNSFDQEITDEDEIEITSMKSNYKKLNNNINKMNNDFVKLGTLNKNKDGSISQRSKLGKEGQRLTDAINSSQRQKAHTLAKINYLLTKPWIVWHQWSQQYCRYLGNRDSIIFMIAGYPIFFFILGMFNILELTRPSFENISDIYIYIVFVAPMSYLFDISVFKEEIFSLLISYDYAVILNKNYDEVYTLYNWTIMTLPMPLLTILAYVISRRIHLNNTRSVKPETEAWVL